MRFEFDNFYSRSSSVVELVGSVLIQSQLSPALGGDVYASIEFLREQICLFIEFSGGDERFDSLTQNLLPLVGGFGRLLGEFELCKGLGEDIVARVSDAGFVVRSRSRKTSVGILTNSATFR